MIEVFEKRLYNSFFPPRGCATTSSNSLFILYTTAVLLYAFFNGFNNSGALIAAPIATRAIDPVLALRVAMAAEFSGPFLFGVAVAATLGEGLVQRSALSLTVLLAAILSAMGWNLVTWLLGFPSSAGHALIGGLIGAVLVGHGPGALIESGMVQVFGWLLLSPALSLAAGYLLMKGLVRLVQNARPSVNGVFKYAQFLTTITMALAHGTNDGQKSMGLITLGLVVLDLQKGFVVPLWVTFACALALTLGVSAGGFRIIRTLGGKIYRMRPIHGFASQLTTSAVLLGATLLGGPVSTTQIAGTTIMGVGAAERMRSVRWGVASQIMLAWLVTIPVVGAASALLYLGLRTVLGG